MLQGGMVLLPDAVIDDGLLDVMALRAKGAVGWAQAGAVLVHHTFRHRLRALRRDTGNPAEREHHQTRPVDFRQGVGITARVLERPAAFQIDGEDFGTVTAFSARIKRRGLTVRVAV